TGAVIEVAEAPVRKRLPKQRPSKTTSFRVGDIEGYLTAGSYPDDGLGEIFVNVSKQGSTLSGVMDAFSIAVSVGLQYGVPLEALVAKFTNMIFAPPGCPAPPGTASPATRWGSSPPPSAPPRSTAPPSRPWPTPPGRRPPRPGSSPSSAQPPRPPRPRRQPRLLRPPFRPRPRRRRPRPRRSPRAWPRSTPPTARPAGSACARPGRASSASPAAPPAGAAEP